MERQIEDDFISAEDIAVVQNQLGQLAVDTAKVDLQGFLKVVDILSSPQALAAGFSTQVIKSASGWFELARLLQPFHEAATAKLEAIIAEGREVSDRRGGSFLGHLIDGLPISGVSGREGVSCECFDPACGCGALCKALAIYEWGSVDEDDWQFLCHRCAERMVERGTRPERKADDHEDGEE